MIRSTVLARVESIDASENLLFLARRHTHTLPTLPLDSGVVDVNAVDDAGETLLIVASLAGHAGIVHLLLAQEDIEADKPASNGATPLAFACYRGHVSIVQLLLAREDIDPKVTDDGVFQRARRDRDTPSFQTWYSEGRLDSAHSASFQGCFEPCLLHVDRPT